MRYMESHDEERLMYKNLLYGNALQNGEHRTQHCIEAHWKMATRFLAASWDSKMIWQLGELGCDCSSLRIGGSAPARIQQTWPRNPYVGIIIRTWSPNINLVSGDPKTDLSEKQFWCHKSTVDWNVHNGAQEESTR